MDDDRREWDAAAAPLLAALRGRQRELGLSDRRFAAELGLSDAMWSFTKRGQKRVGPALLRGTLDRFPEYEALVRRVLVWCPCVRLLQSA